ncbi:hypothetical protein NBRC116594_26920 [Shimia sp. NS0008-38b]|uniref:hypothetical protein n=1 Tax=Shimia sp. NS0008-38b TaxID=3127653 RepID=UPI003102D9F5
MSIKRLASLVILSALLSQAPLHAFAENIPQVTDQGTNAPSQPSLLIGLHDFVERITFQNKSTNDFHLDDTNDASPANTKRQSLRDLIRLEVEQATIYGLFDESLHSDANSVARASGPTSVVGFGVERSLERGLAVNFELFQNTSGNAQNGDFLENTKAALRLRFKF